MPSKCCQCDNQDASYDDLCRECYEDKVRRECHTAWYQKMIASQEYEERKERTRHQRRYDARDAVERLISAAFNP